MSSVDGSLEGTTIQKKKGSFDPNLSLLTFRCTHTNYAISGLLLLLLLLVLQLLVVHLTSHHDGNDVNNSSSQQTQNSGQAGSVLLVITSCLCFIQSSTTFIVLVPLLYKHKCAATFLKMQFCTAIATLSGYVKGGGRIRSFFLFVIFLLLFSYFLVNFFIFLRHDRSWPLKYSRP